MSASIMSASLSLGVSVSVSPGASSSVSAPVSVRAVSDSAPWLCFVVLSATSYLRVLAATLLSTQ